ncbi:hypothetical protein AB0F59_32310 [Micromonospora lupini]|uniref:hypothetical protein n=1 Tax=Micromonospora lupini TaxID=285679 RepID=UPI0034047DBF
MYTEADGRASVLAAAAALPLEVGRQAVMTAPSVTARPDVFELLPNVLAEYLGGVAAGIRLVPFGPFAPGVDPAEEARLLAEWIGLAVTYPMAELVLPQGVPPAPTAWAVAGLDGVVRTEPLWPSPPSPPPPPLALAPAVAVPTPAARRWPQTVPHPAGGFVDLPARPPPRVWRPVLPGWRPADGAAEPSASDVDAVGVPGVRTAAGWSFMGESLIGGRPVLAGFLVEIWLGVTGFRVAGRPLSSRAVAKLVSTCRSADKRPVLLAAYGVPVRGAAANLLFGGLADGLPVPLYVADGPIRRTPGGLLLTTGSWRRWIRRAPGTSHASRRVRVVGPVLPARPVLRPGAVTSSPARPARPNTDVPEQVPTRPAIAVDRPATVSETLAPMPSAVDPEIAALIASQRLVDAARFDMFPRLSATSAGSAEEPGRPADSVALPIVQAEEPSRVHAAMATAVPAVAAVPPVSGASMSSLALADGVHPPPASQPAVLVVPVTATDAAPASASSSVTTPRWFTDADIERAVSDRPALRQALRGRYDAYARVVARTLAESPGLRATSGTSGKLSAGLIALRAYCDGEREAVNQILRGGGPVPEVDRLTLLAQCAAFGLRRLPSVLGPVFRAGPADPSLAGEYRPGGVLIEPAFVDVNLVAATAAGVRFAIWSVSAHRLDGIDDQGTQGGAIFPPGSRFEVLAVDDDDAEQPVRVLLRDLAAPVRGARDSAERILDRLRAVAERSPAADDASIPLAFAPGLDDAGRPFHVPADAGAGATIKDGRA